VPPAENQKNAPAGTKILRPNSNKNPASINASGGIFSFSYYLNDALPHAIHSISSPLQSPSEASDASKKPKSNPSHSLTVQK
jgi:hypothetical protein